MPKGDMQRVTLYRFTDGALFVTPYRGSLSRMRGEETDPESSRVLEFKLHRRHSGHFGAVLEAVRAHTGCEGIVAVPPSSVRQNAVQALVDDEAPVVLVPRHARANRHNAKDKLDAAQEAERVEVDWRIKKRRLGKVLLVDDVNRTGATLKVFAGLLAKWGIAREVVRFSFGAVTTSRRFKRECEIEFSPGADVLEERADGRAAGGGEGRTSDALEDLRRVRVQLAQEELARVRGENIPCATVHAAYGEVVAIVRAGLLALPKIAAVELANQSAAAVERWCDAWARDLANQFQERCGAVGLVDPRADEVDGTGAKTRETRAPGRGAGKAVGRGGKTNARVRG